MKTINLNLDAQRAIDDMVREERALAPDQLKIPEIIPGCEVISLDPQGVGLATFPRLITVRINEFFELVRWNGSPVLTVGAVCTVVKQRGGNTYQVSGSSGAAGTESPTDVYRYVWVYDVSENQLVSYTTIAGALAYPALVSGDYVFIPPGVFDVSFTLVDGVIITEMVPGSVILHSTSADTCVTCADGGYLQVKEVRCTRVANSANAVLCSMGAADTCEIRAELIKANGSGDVGGEEILGVYIDSGILTIHSDIEAELTSDGNASECTGIKSEGGTLYAFGDVAATLTGTEIWFTTGINRNGGDVFLRGHCSTNGDGECWGVYGDVGGGNIVIWGDCSAITAATGATAYGVEIGAGTATIHGNCYCEAEDTAYGARGAGGTLEVYGNCEAVGTVGGLLGQAAYGASCSGATMRVHGDCVSTIPTGSSYGANCEGGTLVVTCGRASGDTYDIRRANGTLQVFMVEFDTYSGTITQYYPMVDSAWIGIAGGAGARIVLDATPATHVVNFATCNVGINEAAPGGMQQITTSGAAVIGLIIKGAVGQTANLQEWQSNVATLRWVDQNGRERWSLTDTNGLYGDVTYKGLAGVLQGYYLNTNIQPTANSAAQYRGVSIAVSKLTNFNTTQPIYSLMMSGSIQGTGSVAEFNAAYFTVSQSVDAPVTAIIRGVYTNIGATVGSVGTIYANYTHVAVAGAAVTTAYGLFINAVRMTSGSLTNAYGIYINDIGDASSLNYAIYTNAGIIHAGDKIEFTQTDGNEYIDSLADGYMDYGATTLHRFNNPLTIANMKTGATQAAAGAAADELWATVGHASLPDYVVMIGV